MEKDAKGPARITWFALKDIKAGEEMLARYDDPDDLICNDELLLRCSPIRLFSPLYILFILLRKQETYIQLMASMWLVYVYIRVVYVISL